VPTPRSCWHLGEVGLMSKMARSPYPGPQPFQQTDGDRFFGRASEALMLAEWWRQCRLTFVVGQAGSGKTSLLQAGILPVLDRAQARSAVLPIGRLAYGSTYPTAALPEHNPYTLGLIRSWSPGENATRLFHLTVREYFQRVTADGIIFAAIDPADELLAESGPRRAYRRRFLEELADALGHEPRLHLLIIGRHEAIDMVADTLGNGARHEVTALTLPTAVEAVSKPLVSTSKTFVNGAADAFVTDLGTTRVVASEGTERYLTHDHVEPALLQVACARLWDAIPASVHSISIRDIRRYGDIDDALTAHCAMVIAQVAGEHNLPVKRLSSWLLSNFVTEFGTLGKAYEGITTTASMPNAVARALEDRHLLVARLESGARWYELISDRLIEPLRQVGDVRPAPIDAAGQLRAAEHALTIGDLQLAEQHATEAMHAPAISLRFRAEACSLLGNVSYEGGKPEDAEAHYREAARSYGAAGDSRAVAYALTAIGRLLLMQGRVAEAADEIYAAVARVPGDLGIQTELAQALWEDDKGSAAVAILNDVLRVDGGNRIALRARGEILAYLGEARQAMRDLDRVTIQGQPSTRAARGLALAQLGEQRAARREIEDAVAEGRHSGPVLLYAARAFALGGDESAAQEHARLASDATDPPLSPRHREVARHLVAGDR